MTMVADATPPARVVPRTQPGSSAESGAMRGSGAAADTVAPVRIAGGSLEGDASLPIPSDVIARAQRGDRRSQAELVRGLQDAWFRFCMGRLGLEDDARDAAQETALRFLKGLPAMRGESSLRTWSLGIALNVCREMRRHSRAEPAHLPEAVEPVDASEPSGTEFERAEQALRLRELLATLTDRQREAVLLRFFEGLSVSDSARAMGCAEGTVKATLSQALAALRRRWESRS